MTTPSPSRLVIQYTWSCSLNKVSEPRTDGQTLGAARPQKGKVVLCHDGWLRRHQGECAVPPRRPHRQSPSYRYIWPSGASLLCLWTSESGWLAREGEGAKGAFSLYFAFWEMRESGGRKVEVEWAELQKRAVRLIEQPRHLL